MVSSRVIKKYGGVKKYKEELARQRTPEYKAMRNARLNRKRALDKLMKLLEEEARVKFRLEQIKLEQKTLLKIVS